MGLITIYQMMFLATVTLVVLAAHRESKRSRASSVNNAVAHAQAPQPQIHRPSAAYFQQTAKQPPVDARAQERIRLLDSLLADDLLSKEEHRKIKARILKQS